MAQTSTVVLPPTRVVRLIRWFGRPLMSRVGVTAVLEVAGRRTGAPTEVSLAPVDLDGTTYLLSMYGLSEWVRNLQVAGRGTLRRKGVSQAIRAVEVDGVERDCVIAAFHTMSPRPFTHDFDRRPRPADHPTFRVEPTTRARARA